MSPPGATGDDWSDDRGKRQDRRTKKKSTRPGTAATWEEELRMRAPQRREKRESGKSWRDYAPEDDEGGPVGEVDEDGDGDGAGEDVASDEEVVEDHELREVAPDEYDDEDEN